MDLGHDRCLAYPGHPRARSDGRELLATWLASLASLLAKNTNKRFANIFCENFKTKKSGKQCKFTWMDSVFAV
jgi:hypothetical protein